MVALGLTGVLVEKVSNHNKRKRGVPEGKGEGLIRRQGEGPGMMTRKRASRLPLEMWAGVLSQWEGLEAGKDREKENSLLLKPS